LTRYSRSAGLRLEGLDETWAAFSARSGDSLQLNAEAAAVLELLTDGALAEEDVAVLLAEASGTNRDLVAAQLRDLWPQLVVLGLIEQVL